MRSSSGLRDLLQRVFDLRRGCRARTAPIAVPCRDVAERAGIEVVAEELDEEARDGGMARQRLLDVGLAEGHADLAEVLGVGAQDDHLVPFELGAEDQAIEAVVLGLAVPDADERVLELLLHRREVVLHPFGVEAEVADAHGAAAAP